MGKMVEQVALAKGHQIFFPKEVEKSDLCIDFSHPDAVLTHLKSVAAQKKNLVIGTTGWEADLDQAKKIVEQQEIGVLYAPNFSIGVHLFLSILDYSAKLINRCKEYDAAGVEFHHANKKDAPSGTALEISRRLEQAIERLDQLNMSAIRCGSIPGKHLVLFDSPFDTISLCHEARSREGFARGAVQAAEWLFGKKGFYTLNDLMDAL